MIDQVKLIFSYFNESFIRKIEGILAITGIISVFFSIYKKIYISIKKKKVFPNSDKPEIKYFTDREEITKEIFEEIERTNSGKIFSIYGPAGIGKSEFMKLINFMFNSSKGKDTESKTFLKRYLPDTSIWKNSQSYIFNCKNQEIKTVLSSIEKSLNLDNDNNKDIYNFDVISSKIYIRTKRCNHAIFIFEDVEKNYLANDLFDFFKILNSYSKKNKYIFFVVYSSLFLPEYKNNSIVKRISEFKIENTKEFVTKHNLNNLSESEINEIHKITNGNLELLNIVVNLIKENGKGELKKLIYSQGLDYYFVSRLSECSEAYIVFEACLALSISQTLINTVQVNILVDSHINVNENIKKLVHAGFLNKSENISSMYTISKVVRSIMYNSDLVDIISFQRQLVKNVENKKLNLGDKTVLHKLFLEEYNCQVIDELKQKQGKKDYSIALAIYELLNISTYFSEYLILASTKFDQILYYVIEALIGAGNYTQASSIIEDERYSQYFSIRNENINESNLNLKFLQANLAHLKNEYNSALDIYIQLLNSDVVQKNVYFKAKAKWGIAHVHRHVGNFEQATEWYKKSIKMCRYNESNTLDVHIKCLNECNSIFVYLNEIQPYSTQFIEKIVQKNSRKFKNEVAKLSTNKYESIIHGKNNKFDKAMILIEETLAIYEKTFERLRFNLYFEKGELLRRNKNFENAIHFFEKSLDSSQHNGDKNIKLYSLLGILLTELESNQYFFNKDKDEQYKSLELCFQLCQYEDSSNIRFGLGMIHVNIVKDLLDNPDSKNPFFKEMLPLF